MKKLLHIAAHLGGGAGKAISGLIKNLDGGYENTIVLLEKPANEMYCDICRNAGAEVMIEPSAVQLLQLVNKSDAVIFNWWAHPLTVDLLGKLDDTGSRLMIWSHINGLQYPVLTPEFLCEFDAVMLTSPCSLKNQQFSEKQMTDIKSKTSFVYGIGDFHPDKMPLKTDYATGEKVRIGYVGTLDFAKLNPESPKICYCIKQRVPNVEFVLCGGYTEEFEHKLFSEYPELKECIKLMGFVSDPEKLLPTFDIFLYPLASENYATTENALLEAMSAGLPVIVLDNPAEREIVDNEITGIVASNIEILIQKTIELCEKTEKRIRLGTSARNAVIEKYDAKANAQRFNEAAEKVLGIEKKQHDFQTIIGNDIWEKFLYFCGNDADKIKHIMQGKMVSLPDIYYSDSKSSPRHYLKYYNDLRFTIVVENWGYIK